MMRRLRTEPDLVGMSTDYSPTDVVFEPYTGNTIILNERNHTWFCIYRQQAFEISQVSHAFHREMLVGAPVERNCWDSCAYFQKSLRDTGLALDHLHGQYRRDFIHYGAFSKNTTVTRESVATVPLPGHPRKHHAAAVLGRRSVGRGRWCCPGSRTTAISGSVRRRSAGD